MPDVLDPDVGAGRKEEPVHRDEEEADHVAGQCDADEKYWKSLKKNLFSSLDKFVSNVITPPYVIKQYLMNLI